MRDSVGWVGFGFFFKKSCCVQVFLGGSFGFCFFNKKGEQFGQTKYLSVHFSCKASLYCDGSQLRVLSSSLTHSFSGNSALPALSTVCHQGSK